MSGDAHALPHWPDGHVLLAVGGCGGSYGGDGGGTHPDNTPATIVITPSTSIIDQSGKVTGAKTGSSSISASAGGVSSASVNVSVMPGTATQLVIRTQPAGAVSQAAPLQ